MVTSVGATTSKHVCCPWEPILRLCLQTWSVPGLGPTVPGVLLDLGLAGHGAHWDVSHGVG